MAFIEIKNLIFSYPESAENALNGVDLSVEEGEICLVIGKSGSGKSTLLRLLKKEIAPYGKLRGELTVNAQSVGFVNQNVESNIVTDTVRSELAFAPQSLGKSREKTALCIAEAASYFNLSSVIDKKTESLSGGTKQITALASVFTAGAELLILDEPVSQLDPAAAEEFINIILKLNREQGTTLLISSHRIESILPYADKVAVMEAGKIIFCGKPAETAEFLIKSKNEMKAALPPYTQAFKDNPIDFREAKRAADALTYKIRKSVTKNDEGPTVKGICFTYKKGLPDIFYGLDYKAEQGKINAIVGANGSGKTTLLKCIGGVLKCYGGKIKMKGKTAYMPQNVQTLFVKDTVFEEIGSEELLIRFGLEHLSDRNPFDLSGGEAQRLALAKIMSVNADILLLDEPTKSVDAVFAAEFAGMLRELVNEGKTVILATHDLEFAGRYADNAAFLFGGRIVASAPVREFFSMLETYTTAISRLTEGKAVSIDDIEVAL
ncbi:MAG: ATP-binding cassette domain-containing protein [Eubacterium sp.]|nr:ATP-binding cassette domain-containing protein [Eubacterium sp.]